MNDRSKISAHKPLEEFISLHAALQLPRLAHASSTDHCKVTNTIGQSLQKVQSKFWN